MGGPATRPTSPVSRVEESEQKGRSRWRTERTPENKGTEGRAPPVGREACGLGADAPQHALWSPSERRTLRVRGQRETSVQR